jgi:hypothetical protein
MFAKFAVAGTIGLVAGLTAVAVIRPLVPAASVLIILLCIAISVSIGLLRRRKTP